MVIAVAIEYKYKNSLLKIEFDHVFVLKLDCLNLDIIINTSYTYSPVLENIQFYIRVLQYDVIVLHNGLYLLFHNFSTEIDEKWA